MRKTRLQRIVWLLPMLFLAFMARGQDLSLGVYSNATTSTVGGSLTFKISVRNDAHTAVTGVEIKTRIPVGTTYVSHSTGGAGTYSQGTGTWFIGAMGAAVDSVVLNIVVQVATDGVIFSQAEIVGMIETDGDSTPNNSSVTEDDWASACATIPVHYNCRDDINALATAPVGYTSYQWYKDGLPIMGADKDTYRIRETGNFNFTASTATTNCPASLCCPISVLRDSCMSLGNLVFDDKDNNGAFNGADVGLNGVQVQLYSVGLDGLKGTPDDRLDSTMTTAAGGLYLFNNLNPGLYYVKLTGVGIPAQYVSSTGGGPNDFSGAGVGFEPNTQGDLDKVDHGTQMDVMVMSSIITLTLNSEPIDDDGAANTNLTVDFGLYMPESLPTLSLGNLVFEDKNNNGVFDTATEVGIDSVQVILYNVGVDGLKNTADDSVVDTLLTDMNGNYLFTDLAVGKYFAKLNGGIPSGMVSSTGDGVADIDGAGGSEPSVSVDVDNADNGTSMGMIVMSNIITLSYYGEPTNDGDTSSLTNLTVDFGLYTPQSLIPMMSLGDLVFNDKDNNGVFDGADAGIENVEVVLYSVGADGLKNTADDIALDSVFTNGTGNYLFTDLNAGQYFVKLKSGIPSAYVSSTGNGIYDTHASGTYEPATLGDVNNADNGTQMSTMVMSNIITLSLYGEPTNDGDTSSLTNLTVDFGLYTPQYASIGNLVWNDTNNDGIKQATETGLSNVNVTLYKFDYITSSYLPVITIQTNVNGKYLFNNLDSGKYYVKIPTIPAGMSSSTGDGVTDIDGAGTYEPSSVTGDNKDKGSLMGTMVVTNPFTLTLGAVDSTVDFGFYTPVPIVVNPTMSLGNSVFNDDDNDGLQSPTEVGIAGVRVVLYAVGADGLKNTADDTKLDSILTGSSGNYLFTGLNPGQYYAKLSSGIPADMVSSTGQGVNDLDGAGPYEPSVVGDVNEADHGTQMGTMIMSNIITMTLYGEPTNDGDTSSLTNLTVDFGLYTPHSPTATLSIGNLVWFDANNDGIHQVSEAGIKDVLVVLYNVGGDNTKGTADDFIVTDTWTDTAGRYLFPLLSEGNYYVKLNGGIPTGMVSSTGGGVTDASGVGTYEPSAFVDINDVDNGSAMGLMIMSNVIVMRLYSEPTNDGDLSSNTNLSVDFGLYTPSLVSASVGNLVWNDANNDGVHQNTEGGIPNVKVIAYKLNYVTGLYVPIDSLFTDANGKYLFTNLDSGKYYIKLPISPTGMSSSTGDGIADLDGAGAFEPATGTADNTDRGTKMGTMIVSNPFNITIGKVDTTVKFGFYTPVQPRLSLSLGNIVWSDTNNDGIKNATETGIDGITVVLYGVGNDGLKNTADDLFIDSLTTASGGLYEFTGLNEGKYFVKLTGTGVPTGFVSSTGGGVADADGAGTFEPSVSIDTNNNDNGTQMGTMVMSGIVNLTYYGEPTNDGDTSSLSNLTVDFGLYKPILPQGVIGNLVWNDANNDGIHQNTEGSLPNIKVDLYKFNYTTSTYDLVTTQNTDANGKYLFNSLDSGKYYVKLPVIPTGMSSSTGDGKYDNDGVGAYEPSTSIADNSDRGTKMGTMVVSNPFVLAINQVDTTVDFGFYVPQSLTCDCPSRQDLVAPSLVGVPADVTLNCQDAVPVAPNVTAIDNCTTTPTVVLSTNTIQGVCAGAYIIQRIWTAIDACGNTSTALQTVSVRDVTPPIWTNVPANVTVNCNGSFVTIPTVPTVTDLCDQNPRVTFVETRQNGTCQGSYRLTRTWTATDVCGNTANASYIVTVEDKIAPTFANVPVNLTLTCGQALPTATTPTATDSCDANSTVTMVQTTPTATTIVRTWTATDACGNSATTSQTITTATNCNTPTLTLGNLVWDDANNNGIKEAAETGIAGVKTILYSVGADGLKNTADDAIVDSLVTGTGGSYLFTGLTAGKYFVKLTGAGVSAGYVSSTGDGAADTDGAGAYEPSTSGDVNERDHGTQMGTMIMSGIVDLTYYGEPTTDGDTSSLSNLTIDFGLYKALTPLTLSLGNLVWNDANNNGIYEVFEAGVPDVMVILYGVGADGRKNTADDIAVDTVLTNGSGNYLFTDLTAGNYFVKLSNIPSGMVSSTGDGIADRDGVGAFEPSTEGDVNSRDHGTQMGSMVMSGIVALTNNGEPTNDGDTDPNTNLTVDFGLYAPVDTGVFDLALIKKLVPRSRGVVVNNGDTIRFRMTIINQGTANAHDIKIKDYVPKGLQFIQSLNTAARTGNINDWAADSTLFVNDLNAGVSITQDIILVVNHGSRDTFFLNKSEIIFATNTEGALVNTSDRDSQADSDLTNDRIGGDNVVNNRNRDEDDHDYAFVIDYPDKDPIGFIYCDKTGKIVTGGTIDVQGPGLVYIIEDGSNGRYQFFTDGTPGVYTMSYSHPDGYPMSTTCAVQPTTLNFTGTDGTAIDRDGVADGFITVGTGNVANGYLTDKSCTNNPYYLTFNSTTSTEPLVLHNNLPIQCSFIGAITCVDNNTNSLIDVPDTPIDSVKVYLYNCVTNAILDSTISIRGNYRFDGLRSGSYKVRAILPVGYRFSLTNISGAPLADSRLDTNGFSTCINLNFGECDTVKGRVCFIPQIFDLALRKTLAVGQVAMVNVGDTVNYTMQVVNQGTMDAYDVDVVDYIPTGMLLADPTWTVNGPFVRKRIAGPIAFGGNASVNIKLKVTGASNQYVNIAEISRASDSRGGATIRDIDSQADSTDANDRGGRWNVIGENDNINGGLNGDEDDSDPAVINVNNIRNGCGIVLNPNFTTTGACAMLPTQFTATTTGFTAYNWNFGDGGLGTGSTVSHQYTAAMGGTFDVTLFVTDNNGCSDSITKQVSINPMVWANAGLDQTICAGESAQLSAQGGTHYAWTPAATLSNASIFNPIARPTVTTTYTVVVSNDFGCSATDSVVVTVNPQPRIIVRTGTVSTCTNGVMPIRIELDQSITNYQITGSAGYSNVVVSGAVITFDATLNGALNNLSVLLTGNRGCTVRDTFNLIRAGNPKADFVVIEPFCNNAETTLLFTGTATAAARLIYNLDDGAIVRQSAATATRPFGDTTVVRFPTFGSKLLRLNVNDGGCVDNATKSIFVRKSPKTVLANKDTTICPNVCVPLYGTAGIFDCVYSWTPITGLSSTNTPNTIACPLVTTTYTLRVTDINGCFSDASVTITVTTPPVLVGVPVDVTVECNNVPLPATTVTERTGLRVAFNEVKTAGNCPNAYTLTRTWTATNYCNLTTTGTQIIIVRDNTAPVLANVPRNVTLSCDETLPSANGVTATDNCDANPAITSNDVKTNGICVSNYTITRTWTARDACNNTSTASQVITVRDINAPMLMNVPMNTTLACDAPLPSATGITAMDNCDAAPRVTFADVKTNGYCANSYTIARTWTATDACGNTSTASQVMIVLDLTKPVLANVPANTTIECTAPVPTTPTVTATDNCDPSVLRVVFAEKRTNTACGYTLTRTWTAIDACGNAGTGNQVITVEDRTAPSFGNTPATVTIDCIEKLGTVAKPTVTDACDPNPLVSVAQSVTDSTCANRKKIVRTYSAKDICGNTQLFTQTINVFDNVGPVITPRNPQLAGLRSGDTLTMACEDIQLFQLGDATAVDNCEGCTPTIRFEDFARRRGTCPIDGFSLLMECLWTATDCCGNKTEWRIFIKVTDNKAPVLSATPANITVASPSQVPNAPIVTATDNCTDSVGVTFAQTLVATGTNCDYIITRTWTALDACGNVTRKTQQILVHAPPLDIKAVKTDETCAKNDGTITMIPSSGIAYLWSDGVRGAFRTGLKAGSYTVTASVGLCEKTLTVIILDACVCQTPVIATIAKTDATCGNSNGSVTVTSDNAANYTFTWSSNTPLGSGVTRSNLPAGFYTVTVTRTATPSCSTVLSVNVSNNTAGCCTQPVATIVKEDATCGNSDGLAKVTVDNVANYTFQWSFNGVNLASTGAQLTGLAAGTYSVTVARIADATCTTVVTANILNNTANCCTTPIATVTKTDATCGGSNGSASLTVDNAANYTFTWSANAPAGTGASRSGLAAGTYSVTVVRINNPTCLTIVTTTLANNTGNCCTPPVATVTKTDATCAQSNGSATVAVIDGVANYTFTWSSNAPLGSGASHTSLSSGDYTITVARVNNPTCLSIVSVTVANNTEGCCNIIQPTSIVKTLIDCNGTAEVCVEIAPARLTNYTITNNGVAYTGGFGTCQAGSTLNLPSGQHQLIFRNNVLNCSDTLNVKVVCIREMTAIRNIDLPSTNEYCLTPAGLGLTGTIVSIVNECAASADNSQLTINNTTFCVSYKALSVGSDTACLKVTSSTGDVVNMRFVINVTSAACAKFINQDSVIITNACTDSTKVCVNIPFDMITDYAVLVNGSTYRGTLEGCRKDTLQNYSLFVLTQGGATGPYNLVSWTVNGRTFSASNLSSMQILVDSMNRFDPTGRWMFNSATLLISGGNLRNTYSSMTIQTVSRGNMSTIAVNQSVGYRGTSISVLRGRSSIAFFSYITGCFDSVIVNAACISPQYVENTLLKGKVDTLCIDTRQLLGTRYRIQTLTNGTGRFVNFSNVAGTTCVSRAALNVGTERITYTVSDEYGMTDTIYVTTHVTESALIARRPVALNDRSNTTKAKAIYVDVMTNDSIFTNKGAITIVNEPKRGTAIIMADFRILYTPNADYCNTTKPDVLTYKICNQAGCDTATVEVMVTCDQIKIFSGFSPNNDGVNDFFVIEGAETYAKNTLTIYNRWGTAVLDTKGYKNDWGGNWDEKSVPDGTYFYLFNDGEGNQVSGYIQIQR